MLDKQDIETIKELLHPINNKLDKHSIILENMDKKLNTVIEGQQAHTEQIERLFKDLKSDILKGYNK